nr:hypothetical protein [Tanacetum cinerariifolium]
LTNTDATDSGPEPSFNRPAIFGVPFWHQVLISQVSSKDLTNTDATDSGPEPSFNRPAIFGVPFWHQCLYHKSLQRSKLIVTTSFRWSGPAVCSGNLLLRVGSRGLL